ncbi:MAG TPA: hypothetical protein VGK74_00975 [Symbiobacteriaceae bacterium]
MKVTCRRAWANPSARTPDPGLALIKLLSSLVGNLAVRAGHSTRQMLSWRRPGLPNRSFQA